MRARVAAVELKELPKRHRFVGWIYVALNSDISAILEI